MDNHLESSQMYIIFEVADSMLAIPISETLGIMQGTSNTPLAFLPKMPDFVRCIIEIEGQLVTVINIPGIYDNTPIAGSSILVLKCDKQNIGIIAKEIQLITIFTKEILENKVTGIKNFTHDNKIYSILDTALLYRQLGV